VAGGHSQRGPGGESEQPAADVQRELLVAAIARAIAEHGSADLTVEHIVRYAGVSDAIFYEHFSGTEQALIVANDAFFDHLWDEVADVCDSVQGWPMRVRAAVDAILSYLAEVSNLARVFAIETAAVSLAASERQFAALERFAALLRDGRRLYPRAASLPAPTERALVGGIASIISAHLLAEEADALAGLQPDLVELVLVPYLGQSEAKRVARA
jgi:AcrR family transcriptional regulator